MFNKSKDEFHNFVYLALQLILVSNFLPFNPYKCLFLLPIFVFAWLFRVSIKWLAITLVLSILLVLLQQVIPEIKGTYLSHFLNQIFPLNKKAIDYLFSKYPKEVAEVISFVIFNRKEKSIYSQFQELGIPFLVTISGIHFLLIRQILLKLLRNQYLVLLIILVYWAAIDYSIPALRVILASLIKIKDPIKKWSVVSLVSLAFNIHIYRSLSFLLSYFFSLIFTLNRRFKFSKLSLYLIDSWSAFIFSTLVFLPYYPHRIYPLSLINSLIFTPVIIITFLYFFFSWFIPIFINTHSFVTNIFLSLNKSFSLNTSSINLESWDYSYSCLLLCFFSLLFVIFLYRCYFCTIPKTKVY